MTDPAQTQATGPVAVPTPSCIRPRRGAGDRPAAELAVGELAVGEAVVGEVAAGQHQAGEQAGSRRSTARDLLDAALAGIRLNCRDRQFVSRLVHWDKRNAASVASLLVRARQAGREEAGREEASREEASREEASREEAGLTPRQRELIIAALSDAAEYRASGAAGTGCWDCEMIPGGRCASHARDNDRARSYAELAVVLSGVPTQPELARPMVIAGFRRRTPVAS